MATLPEDALGEPDPMRKDEDTETGVDAGAAAGAASGAADVAASEATHGPSGGLSAQRRVLRVLVVRNERLQSVTKNLAKDIVQPAVKRVTKCARSAAQARQTMQAVLQQSRAVREDMAGLVSQCHEFRRMQLL